MFRLFRRRQPEPARLRFDRLGGWYVQTTHTPWADPPYCTLAYNLRHGGKRNFFREHTPTEREALAKHGEICRAVEWKRAQGIE